MSKKLSIGQYYIQGLVLARAWRFKSSSGQLLRSLLGDLNGHISSIGTRVSSPPSLSLMGSVRDLRALRI